MHRKTGVGTVGLVLVVALAGCVEGGEDAEADAHAAVMAQAREVSQDLDTPEEAWAAGYRPDAYCIPGMGVHWIHKPGQPDSYFDGEIDPEQPEAVLFVPQSSNVSDAWNQTFAGVEYIVVTEGTPMNESGEIPPIMGQPFDGPMPGHVPGMPWHAEVHVYLMEGAESPEGFPASSDAIECPEGTTPPAGA